MFFELETALRFLRPQKTQLARTLIALSSLGVVSVVSWLVIVFYSVTEGLEKRWIDQMVQVSGSLRVVPTYAYFDHSDFLIDSYRASTAYQPTLLYEKIEHPLISPDELQNPLPEPLKEVVAADWVRPSYKIWKLLKDDQAAITLSTSVSLEVLQFRERAPTFLTAPFMPTNIYRLEQTGYLTGFYPSLQALEPLILTPEVQDWNHLLLALGQPQLQHAWPALQNWMKGAKDLEVSWKSPKVPVISLDTEPLPEGQLNWIETDSWHILKANMPSWNKIYQRWLHHVTLAQASGPPVEVEIPAGFLHIDAISTSHWMVDNTWTEQDGLWIPILAPKVLKDVGLTMGSILHLKKERAGPLGVQSYEQEAFVIGFYDSGIMPLGGRFLIAPYEKVSSWIEPEGQDPTSQFFQAWPKNPLQKAKELKTLLEKERLSSLFNVQSYEDYEASYDLLIQLRSDRVLLSIIAFIILIVASSSVCTMMVLLVNERRKEIAVLKTLGMSSKRLCSCFALSGLILGALGAFIGISLAQITLTNLDLLIQYISYLQGSPLLNPIYYGKTLPNTMSPHAVKMVLMGNTTLALLGSCLAAWQTSRLNPADIFRSL